MKIRNAVKKYYLAVPFSSAMVKPILMISMGLFFCGAIIAFLMRIYHSV